jgi:type I restriction enzyme S subunit
MLQYLLKKHALFLNGLACQKFPPKNNINRLPVLKIKELSSGITENSDWATTEVNPEYVIKSGDIIFAWSASLMVKIWTGETMVLVPTNDEIKSMSAVMNPVIQKTIENSNQIRTLTTLRETLLPKLMSGEESVEINSIFVAVFAKKINVI